MGFQTNASGGDSTFVMAVLDAKQTNNTRGRRWALAHQGPIGGPDRGVGQQGHDEDLHDHPHAIWPPILSQGSEGGSAGYAGIDALWRIHAMCPLRRGFLRRDARGVSLTRFAILEGGQGPPCSLFGSGKPSGMPF